MALQIISLLQIKMTAFYYTILEGKYKFVYFLFLVIGRKNY